MIGIGFLTALGPGLAILLGAVIVWAVVRHHYRVEDRSGIHRRDLPHS